MLFRRPGASVRSLAPERALGDQRESPPHRRYGPLAYKANKWVDVG
jgi:hypothetical protein